MSRAGSPARRSPAHGSRAALVMRAYMPSPAPPRTPQRNQITDAGAQVFSMGVTADEAELLASF